MRAVFAFCFVLERCKTKQVRLERFCGCLVLQKSLLATEGSTINKIPNIPQCTLPPRPVQFTRPSFRFFEGLVPRLFSSSLVPRPLPDCISQPWRNIDFISQPWRKIDFISQPWRKSTFLHGCEIKSESGRGYFSSWLSHLVSL